MTIIYQNIVNDATFATGAQRRVAGMAFVATASGLADKITVYTNADGHTFKVGIYDNASPIQNAALIGGQSNLANSVAGGFVELTLNSPANLVAGQTYRFAICSSTSNAIFGANNAISQTRQNGSVLASMSDPLPNPWATGVSTTGSIRMPYVIMEASSVSISSIDQFVAGESFSITFNSPAFVAETITITDGSVTKTIPITGGSGIAPMWVADATCLKFGNVTITATDGETVTEPFVQNYQIFSNYYTQTLISVSSSNYRSGTTPSLKINSNCCPPNEISIDDSGVDSSNTVGEFLIYDRDPDDFVCRTFTIVNLDGDIVPPVMPADRTVTIYEGATTLGTFPASSGTPPISYAIGGADAALFTINSSTAKVDPVGALTLGQSGVITVTPENSAGIGDPQTINWSVIAVPDVDRGLTATGLAAAGLTATGLTAVGL